MKIKNKFAVTFALFICLIQSAIAFQIVDSDPQNKLSRNPNYPEFGSGAASIRHYNLEASSIIPSQVITSTNETLSEIKLGKDAHSVIGIQDIGDEEFALLIDGKKQELTFFACYGRFAAYALDLTGNGTMEILVEHGAGRGTSVYERSLSIYAINENSLQLKHKIQLSGWHDWDAELERSVAWAKGYIIERDENGKVVLRLEGL